MHFVFDQSITDHAACSVADRDMNPDDITHVPEEQLLDRGLGKRDWRAAGAWMYLCKIDSEDELEDIKAQVRECKTSADLEALKDTLRRRGPYTRHVSLACNRGAACA